MYCTVHDINQRIFECKIFTWGSCMKAHWKLFLAQYSAYGSADIYTTALRKVVNFSFM